MLSTAITLKFRMCPFLDEGSCWFEKLLTDIKQNPLMSDKDETFGGSLVFNFREWRAGRYITHYDWLPDRWPLTPLGPSWKCSRRDLTMILFPKRNCELIAQFLHYFCHVLWQKSRAFVFSFYFQFSTPCTSMTTSKSGVKIRIALFLVAWRCFSLSTICEEKFWD